MANYKVNYYSPSGILRINGLAFSSLTYMRRVNTVGQMNVLVPPLLDPRIFEPDGRLELYRSISGGSYYLEGETSFLVERIRRFRSEAGEDQIEIQANDMLKVLARRVVAYSEASSYTIKLGELADDCMKEVVLENFGASALDTARNISTYLTVEANTSLGAAISAEISWKNVLDVMTELAQASLAAGVAIFFDIVKTAPNVYQFRTYKDYRGVDHSRSGVKPVILSDGLGNLSAPEIITDYTDERNHIYCGGLGESSWRPVQESYDAASRDRGPFSRAEYFYNEGNTSDPAVLLKTAGRVLESTRARVTFNGQALNTPSYIYGLDYGFGDLVTATHKGESFDCRVDAVKIDISANGESLDIRLAAGDGA